MLDDAKDRLVDLSYAAGWGLVKSAPNRVARGSFARGADAAAVRNGKGARQLRKNLRRVVGPRVSEKDLDELVVQGLRSYARYWLETFRLPKIDKRHVHDATEPNVSGIEHFDAAYELGRGVVVALPHLGNWDCAGLWLIGHTGKPFATVAERLKPASLFDRFVAYRESLGFEVLPLTGGERPPLEVLKERLLAGGIVCLVADRDLSRTGIPVQFFGEPARMPGGPAMLAATTGAALVTAGPFFTDDNAWGVSFRPAAAPTDGRLREEVLARTQSIADNIAEDIAAHPTDWHMLQKFWPADLPPRAHQPVEDPD